MAATFAEQPTTDPAAEALEAAEAAQADVDALVTAMSSFDSAAEIKAALDAIADTNLLTDAERAKLTALAGNWKLFYTNGSGDLTALALPEAGQVLQSNGEAAAPSFVNGWRRIWKTADETIAADNALGADAALTMALEASTLYTVRGLVLFNSANATMDIQFDLNYGGTLSGDISSHLRFMTAGVSAGTDAETVGITNAAVGATPVTGAGSGRGRIYFEQTFTTNAAGTYAFRWAQNTSDPGNLSVLKGSYIEFVKCAN